MEWSLAPKTHQHACSSVRISKQGPVASKSFNNVEKGRVDLLLHMIKIARMRYLSNDILLRLNHYSHARQTPQPPLSTLVRLKWAHKNSPLLQALTIKKGETHLQNCGSQVTPYLLQLPLYSGQKLRPLNPPKKKFSRKGL